MTTIRSLIQAARAFAKDESGATAVEYGLFVALIAAVIVGAVTTIGQDVLTALNTVAGAI